MKENYNKISVNEYIGKQYGLLTIIEDGGYNKHRRTLVSVRCKCGIVKKYILSIVRFGKVVSCGCDRGKHSITHGLRNHPLYNIWCSMKSRCYIKSDVNYKNYGAKGVSVCEEWKNDFKLFYDWAICNGWKIGLHIDKDIKGNGKLYSPENCSFVTRKVNNNHTTRNNYVIYNDNKITVSELSEITGVKYQLLLKRINSGWELNNAINTKPRINFSRSKMASKN